MDPLPRAARLSIRQKFLLAVAGSAAVLAAIGLVVYTYTSRELRSDAKAQLSSVADLEQARLEQQLRGMTDKLQPIVSDRGIGRDIRRYIRDPSAGNRAQLRIAMIAVPAMSGLESLSLYTRDGRRIATDAGPGGSSRPQAPPGSARALVLRSVAAGQPWTVGRAFPSPTGGSYVHAVQVRVRDRVIAVLVAECNLAPIADLVGTHSGLGDTADAHLVQATERGAQFVTDLRFNPAGRWSEVPWARAAAPAIQAVREPPPPLISDVRDYRGETVIAALRPLGQTPWVLVTKVDESEAYALARRLALVTFLAFLVAVGILAAVIMLVSRSVTGRIRRVTEKATAISHGDLQARVGDRSRDELGVLAGAFDRMADALSEDIGRRERVEAQLEHQAGHDTLTGLPNRTRFEERLLSALGTPTDARVAVLFCDLDEFKSVNDELGHAAGDQLLTVVAHRFKSALRPSDMLARFGGDEFVVVCTGITDPPEAEAVASRLQLSLADPVVIGTSEAYVSVSIGIALDAHGATPESMVRDADAAMYRAKELGRRRHVTHDDEIRERAGARMTAATDLRRAIEQGRLALVFQPIVSLRDSEVVAMEALVRWPRNGEWIAPADFVPRAQELGLGGALDRWVVRHACQQLAQWRRAGGWDGPAVTVNVSPTSLSEPELPDDVLRAVRAAGIEPHALILEVTEEALSLAGEPAIHGLERLREAGVRIAVDDFGTGHSTLARLRDLPVDIMKLDRLLVEHVDREDQARDIALAVLRLAATMNMLVVAEGVERVTQRDALVALGCDCGQGFHFAAPERDPRRPADLLTAG